MVVRIFTGLWKSSWCVTLLLLSLVEVIPFHSENVPPPYFYSYEFAKGLIFLILGWQTPLAFKTSNPLTLGLVVSLGTSTLVEGVQILSFGHKFSVLELLLKVVIICVGFILGLMVVHDKEISFIHLKIGLVWNAGNKARIPGGGRVS